MPNIYPFRAAHYNLSRFGTDLSLLTSQPYDKIGPELQQKYHQRHPDNIVRAIKGKEFPNDTPQENVYSRAATLWEKWLREETIRREVKRAVYPYHLTYKWIDGRERTRKGFLALLELEDFSTGAIKPHEKTLEGPKRDRLNLLRATRTHLEPIYILYEDPEGQADRLLAKSCGPDPFLSSRDDDGHLHRIWQEPSPEVAAQLHGTIRNMPMFIADGHHRYETALAYRDEMRKAGARCEGTESYDSVLAAFVNLHDPGLSIFPTHRIVHSVEGLDHAKLLSGLDRHFKVSKVGADPATLVAKMQKHAKCHCFGLALRGDPNLYMVELKESVDIDSAIRKDHILAWKRLDVSILHELILEPLLRIDADALAKERNVRYRRHAEEALSEVRMENRGGEKPAQLAFLLNPTPLESVKSVASGGGRMPQKSTDFYPKLLTGLVMCPLDVRMP